MSWNDIYRKWGLSEEAITGLNAITWLMLGIAVIMAGILIVAGLIEWYKQFHPEDDKNIPIHKKAKWKRWISAIVCLFAGIIWPIILGIMDSMGVGKITSGDFVPKLFNLINLIQNLGAFNI